ncbi:MAG: TetR/AcrR family transcriptional regulator [Microbacteriaceae bacterium]|nr:TetR/AcrR family transcriptional regulator [Microbacteriaceae bacterium]
MSRSAPEAGSAPYHHGRLREALVEAGVELAREGGADAVVLREATRRVGVTARAAYRHFSSREALVDAVSLACLAKLAERIEAEWPGGAARGAGVHDAADADPLRYLIAVGDGYIAFALEEPGWFDAAMFVVDSMAPATDPAAAGRSGRTAFELLQSAIGALVEAGRIPPDSAQSAAIACWSSVHGFALLASRGPLRQLPPAERDAAGRGLVRDVAAAVAGGPAPAPAARADGGAPASGAEAPASS